RMVQPRGGTMTTDPRIGTELAGYRIESLLGRGGMSVVYLAEQEFPKRKVALKLLAPELAEDGAFRERFIRESNAAASIDDPYIAPEQILGKPVDGRADVYSLGCVLYECLTGDVPFPGDVDMAAMWAHVHEKPPKATAKRPELPPGIDEVIVKALAKSPDDRFA